MKNIKRYLPEIIIAIILLIIIALEIQVIKSNKQNNIMTLQEKREEVLRVIKPICNSFGYADDEYEYIADFNSNPKELLVIGDARICCTGNSIKAVRTELLGFLFIQGYRDKDLGHFKQHIFNKIMVHYLPKPEEDNG